MPTALHLTNGALRCDIAPAIGGAVAGLWLGDIPVLRSTAAAALHNVRESGSYPLVPFSNRVGDAVLRWDGAQHPLLRNFEPEPHAIHGVGWQRAWSVVEAQPRFVQLSLQHPGDQSWPFAFACTQSFRLGPRALELLISVTNHAAHAVPMGLGWHPYFVKRPGSHLRFDATGRWEMGPDKLPTVCLPLTGLDTLCAALEVDHCFEGWHGDLLIRDKLLHTRVRSNLSYLVVFTNAQRGFVAIEPVSHVNNALQLAQELGRPVDSLGVQVLQAGESMSAWMEIDVAAA